VKVKVENLSADYFSMQVLFLRINFGWASRLNLQPLLFTCSLIPERADIIIIGMEALEILFFSKKQKSSPSTSKSNLIHQYQINIIFKDRFFYFFGILINQHHVPFYL